MSLFLWGILPYAMIVILVGGTIWRYRYDKFGWTTRSSQLYESRILRYASPLFHFGILMVIVGHLGGLVIPQSWTDAVGLSEHGYHLMALVVGTIAGVCTLVGISVLIYRRRTTGPVFMATTKNDKAMYVVLVAAIVFGLLTTLLFSGVGPAQSHNYRESVSPWFRSIFILQPNIDSMAEAPTAFHVHTLVGMLLFAIFPFTRLVHAFTAPVHYLFRPYIVYRSRDTSPSGSRSPRPGWSPVGTRDRDQVR
ncbi:respiratory nitrate reductase subunit gamma [Microlunatus elymi]|uniref:Nitrate reductase-like protein NarX n=1 Tax=Microlunatus elymi TaxID=2596828 RepID=A0A516Q4B4_9ACTN|nr:respiratory nitrate reductase subunit gamma [Microlunatus elymi]QDP98280.1 respiratory nitrate reductase subunit gamma [Microlunatus elymi]